jgi:predicted transcriptional regulator of viral defense system
MASRLDQEALRRLPTTFRYGEARSLMNERRFRDLLAQHLIIRLSRGLYRKAGAAGDEDLIEIAAQRPRATLCLRTALARHDLIDDIPAELDIALPRGIRPANTSVPVAWHQFDRETFDVGRHTTELDEATRIGIYSAERSIIDAFRFREKEGPELGNEALRRWLRRGGQPSTLMRMATQFRKGAPALRHALEVLL